MSPRNFVVELVEDNEGNVVMTIPKLVMEALGVVEGDELEFIEKPPYGIIMRKKTD